MLIVLRLHSLLNEREAKGEKFWESEVEPKGEVRTHNKFDKM